MPDKEEKMINPISGPTSFQDCSSRHFRDDRPSEYLAKLPPASFRSSAFTLTELLVVVAILGILISLLLPSLRSAKETAKSIVCINNLRQIGSAVFTYAGENDGNMPPPLRWWRILGDKKYVGPPDPPFGPNTSNLSYAPTWRRYPVFHCPADRGAWVTCSGVPDKISTRWDHDLCNNSYDYNFSINGYDYWPSRNIGQPPDCAGGAGAAWLYIDGHEINLVTGEILYVTPTTIDDDPKGYYAFRHPGKRANAVFLDGHCGTLQSKVDTGQNAYVRIWTTGAAGGLNW